MTRKWQQAEEVAEQVVGRARSALVGNKCPTGELQGAGVATIFHYGAVDIDTKHLTIWVLLDGAPQEDLPTWWSPDGTSRGTSDGACDSWLRDLASTIRRMLTDAGWPNGERVTVLFDSEKRVEEGGGFFYFK